MIVNYNKCCQCGEQKKEKDLLIFWVNNCKFSKCKDCFQKNLVSNSQTHPESLLENIQIPNKINIIPKNENKKLDLKEPHKNIKKTNLMNKKKRRISKKIHFKHKIGELNKDEFMNIIYIIIEESAKKYKLFMNSQTSKKFTKIICNLCNKTKLNKENKFIEINSLTVFKDFFNYIFNQVLIEDYKQKLVKISQTKYNQIIENKKDIYNLKSDGLDKDPLNKKYCFGCIYNSLIKNKGILLLWEDILPEEKSPLSNKKKLEIISGLEDMLFNSNKNMNNFKEINSNEENTNSNKLEKNSLFNDSNNIFNDKKVNIFDLILGSEDEDNNINDLENNSDENKSIKNKNNNETKKNDKKEKKNKSSKKKENKKTFMKTEINDDNFELNKNINNNSKNNLQTVDNNKNINIINMNNINNINQFNDQKFIKKHNDQIQPLLYNSNYNSNFLNQNNMNNNIGYFNNNNNFLNPNEELIYDRLNNQLSFLKNKINLITNLNNTRINNNNTRINNNNDFLLLISQNNFKENVCYFKNSMHIIFNYMNNLGEMLEKYSCINEHSLNLIDSIINGTINTDVILQLKNNHNHLSQLLNNNYNIQKMNSELCDIISKHLNY